MRKLFNSLRYGSTRTKRFLWGIIVLLVMAAVSVVLAIAVHPLVFGIIAFVLVIAAVVIISMASFTDSAAELQQKEGSGQSEEPIRAAADDSQSGRAVEHTEKISEETDDETQVSKDYLEHYNKKSLRKLFRYYRMTKENVPILIDMCPSHRIRQCPAYVWKDKKHVCFLLLEKSPRSVSVPVSQMKLVTYQKGVDANPLKDYRALKFSDEIDEVFGGLLPRYYQDGERARRQDRKNLYVIAGDIAITAPSLRELMKLFSFTFEMNDSVLSNNDFSSAFREAYRYRMLFADGVVSQKDYQEQIRQIMSNLSKNESISMNEFDRNISQMVRYRLITREYAEFFEARRAELQIRTKKK